MYLSCIYIDPHLPFFLIRSNSTINATNSTKHSEPPFSESLIALIKNRFPTDEYDAPDVKWKHDDLNFSRQFLQKIKRILMLVLRVLTKNNMNVALEVLELVISEEDSFQEKFQNNKINVTDSIVGYIEALTLNRMGRVREDSHKKLDVLIDASCYNSTYSKNNFMKLCNLRKRICENIGNGENRIIKK